MVKDTIPTKELKLEGKDEEFLRQYSKENIERIISLNYLKSVKNARLWRYKNYQGGEHGLRNDEKMKEKEIRRAQEYLNFMIKKGIIGGSEIKVDGKYGPQTKSAIEAFQKKVNVFIK